MSGTVTTPIFTCGWECRITTDAAGAHWSASTNSGTPGLSIDTSFLRSGLASLLCDTTGGGAATFVARGLPASTRTFAGRFYFSFRVDVSGTATIMQLDNANGDFKLQARVGRKLRVQIGAGTASADSAALTADQWYRIDYLCNSSDGTWDFFYSIDGVSQTGITGQVTTAADCTNFKLGNTGTNTGKLSFDDLAYTLTLADYPIGAGSVLPFRPTACGTHSFTAGDFQDDASSNLATNETASWADLDEAPVVNTDFVKQVVIRAGGYLEYIYAFNGRTPRAVEQIVWVHNLSTSGNTQSAQLYDGTTATDAYTGQSSGSVAGTVRSFTKQWATPPSGGSWTQALFALLRIRWGFSSDITTNPALDATMLEVEFSSSVAVTTTDALSSSDAAAKQLAAGRSVTDSVTQSAPVTRAVTLARAPSDTLHAADAFTRTLVLARALSDGFTMTDAAVKTLPINRTVTDAVHFAERVLETFADAIDSLTITDVATRVIASVRTAVDSLTASDAVNSLRDLYRTLTDTLTASDATTRTTDALRTTDDAVTVLGEDSSVRALALVRDSTDTLTTTDEFTQVRDIQRSTTDVLRLLEPGIMRDTFTRTVSNGWGSSDAGEVWTTPINVRHSVNGTQGVFTTTAATQTDRAWTPNLRVLEPDIMVIWTSDKLAVGGAQSAWITLRQGSIDDAYYSTRFSFNTDQTIDVAFVTRVGGVETQIGSTTVVTRETHAAGIGYFLRMNAVGASPTVLGAKVWRQGTAEPTAYDLTLSDSEATLQAVGGIGLRGFSGAATNTPITWTWDDLGVASATSRSVILSRSTAETLTLSELPTRAIGLVRAAADSITSSDAVTAVRAMFRTVSDALSMTDAAGFTHGYVRSTIDSLTTSDVALRAGAFVRSTADSLTHSDAVTRSGTFARSIADSVTHSDAVTRVLTLLRSTPDVLTFLDDARSGGSALIRSAVDSLTHSDLVTRTVGLVRSTANSLAFSDAVSRMTGILRGTADSLATSDAVTRSGAFLRAVADALHPTDVVTRSVDFVRSTVDSLTHSDAVTRAQGLLRDASDALGITDVATNLHNLLRSAVDAITFSDVASAVGRLFGRGQRGPRGSVVNSVPLGSAEEKLPEGEVVE